MNLPLVMAGLLTIALGILHSSFGERRFFPVLLSKRGIASEPLVSPRQLGVLRGTWHTLSLFGYGLGAVLFTIAIPAIQEYICVQRTIAIACGITGIYWAYATRLWHLAWVAFLLVGTLCWCA
jgi:hypothetical protein